MDKKFITTIILEHVIDHEEKNTIYEDLTKRLLPKGKVDITIDSITVQDAPMNMQPEYYQQLIALAEQYTKSRTQAQYYQEPQSQIQTQPQVEEQEQEQEQEQE